MQKWEKDSHSTKVKGFKSHVGQQTNYFEEQFHGPWTTLQ
jgi:hypothetical protein